MIKKQIGFSLVVIMLIVAFTVTVFAADNSVSVTLKASAFNVKAGDTVTVTVDISESTGFLMGCFEISYDTESLHFDSYEEGKDFAKYQVSVTEDPAGTLSLSITTSNLFSGNVTETGEVAVLTFTVLEGFSGETGIEIYKSNKGFMSSVESDMSTDYTITGDELYFIDENHQHNIVVDEAVTASCTTPGKTEGKHCSVCKEVLVAQEEVPAGHKEVIDAAVAATCTTPGKTEGKHCSVCEEVLVAQEEIPAGHKEVIDTAVAATCTTAGKTEGKHCSVCEEVLVAQEEIPAGHKEVIDTAVAATCTTAGKTEGKHCSVCEEVLVAQEEIPATGHKEVIDAAVAATCTTAGKTEGKHCSVCEEVFVAQEEVPATGHNFDEWVTVKEATKDSDGIMEHVCKNCGEKETKTIVLANTGLSTGAVIGIVAAVVVVAAAAVVAVVYFSKRKTH